ncbi:hypothetical protein Q7P36_005918 [Cladosporium allicinum]
MLQYGLPAVLAIALTTALIAHFVIAYYVTPRPIPGIPWARNSLLRVVYIFPQLLLPIKHTRYTAEHVLRQCGKLQTPVAQICVWPFVKPVVVLMDGREAHDILTSRAAQFDLAPNHGNFSHIGFRQAHLTLDTGRAQQDSGQRLNDLMTTSFLVGVAAPKIERRTKEMIALWTLKAELAPNATIDVMADIWACTTDAIIDVTLGVDIGSSRTQSEFLESFTPQSIESGLTFDSTKSTELLSIPRVSPPPTSTALKLTAESMQTAMDWGYMVQWLQVMLVGRYRRAFAYRDKLLWDCIRGSSTKVRCGVDERTAAACAVDVMVANESRKKSKEPQLCLEDEVNIHEELRQYLHGSCEPVANTISRALKYLTIHQNVQNKLRKTLLEVDVNAKSQGATSFLGTASVPYLDAVVQEVLRLSVANISIALEDTKILGHIVPAGTEIVMPVMDPETTRPSVSMDVTIRTEARRDRKQWNDNHASDFYPERWLTEDKDGEHLYDTAAARTFTSSEGRRSCYSKQMKYPSL